MNANRHRQFAVLRGALFAVIALAGVVAYSVQHSEGLAVTGLSREAPWGLYIAQFTFLVGIAASSVIVVVPYHVFHRQEYARLVVLGETVALLALLEAMVFVLVDVGQPARVLNLLLYPSLTSLLFWDFVTLGGYWVLCLTVLAAGVLSARGHSIVNLRPLVSLSIPWAVAVHVVTALLYAGLAARPGWMTAILALRFLATAAASGTALLVLLDRWVGDGNAAVQRELGMVLTIAWSASLLCAGLEVFTATYSGIPAASEHLRYQYVGLDGHWALVPWMLLSLGFGIAALVGLIVHSYRYSPTLLGATSGAVLFSVFVDKGLCLVVSGFVPSPLGNVADYTPSVIELTVVAGIHAAGVLAFTVVAPRLLALHPRVAVSGAPNRTPLLGAPHGGSPAHALSANSPQLPS